MQAATYQDVLSLLDEILAQAKRDNDRIGYFAALYKRVTIRIHESIERKEFDDNERMERMVTTFANRYLEAMVHFREKRPATGPWLITFEATRLWPPTLLQHLLLAMNAHINFDLGIAAATVCPGDQLESFRGDFDKINTILGSLMDSVIAEFGQIWPIITAIHRLIRGKETVFLNLDMSVAREHAWNVAHSLAALDETAREPVISKLDGEITLLGKMVAYPGYPINFVMLIFRLTDRKKVPQVIDILSEPTTA